MRKGHLLSVDWDFFFPTDRSSQLYDWGHSEKMPFLMGPVWVSRAAGFLQQGMALPRCHGWERFWERFRFQRGAVLYYAESHAQAIHLLVRSRVSGRVVNFDAHHDLGYGPNGIKGLLVSGRADCANWLAAYSILLGNQADVVLPPWQGETELNDVPRRQGVSARIDDGSNVQVPFGTIMVARSGSWTPSWCDDDFQTFIESCPVQHKVDLDGILGEPLRPREFEVAQAETMAREWREKRLAMERATA